MKRFNKIFAVCLTLSVLGGSLLPSPWTCGGFTEPVPIEVHADGEPTTIDSGIGVLITMLLANGIRFVGNFDDTVKPGIQKLWDDFTTATGNTVTLATLGAQSVVQLGYLRTSSAVNNAVNAFQQWYTDTFSVTNTGSVSIPVASDTTYVEFSGFYTYIGPNNSYGFCTDSQNKRFVSFYSASDHKSIVGYVFLDQPFYYGSVYANSCSATNNLTSQSVLASNKTYYYITDANLVSGSSVVPTVTDVYVGGTNTSSLSRFAPNALTYAYGDNAVIGDISMTGQTLELKDGFNISNDQAKLIDLAGIESLVGTLGLTLDNINDLVDSIPLIMDYPWADTFPDDPAFADTPDDAIPWVDAPTAVVPAEVPEYVPETPADEGSYKVLGLERVFPFSIPFDFIAVVNLLNAEPVCPEFTFRVYNPISGQNIDATMSFERFEAVAQVIRIVETIGFIVFLILITRSLIRS